MKLLLTVLVAAIAAVSAKSLQGRIIGGSEATPHSIPFQVFFHVSSATDTYIGAGSLISPNYVLTAASIVFQGQSVRMFFGKHNITIVEDTEVQMVSTDIILHPGWSSNNMDNDIALIKLPEPIEFTAAIQPAILPKFSDVGSDYINDEVTVSGWGKAMASSTKPSEVLRVVETQVYENFYCSMIHPGYVHKSLCTRGDSSGSTGVGICTGDSGSPLVNEGVQIGVANLASWYGCSEGWPSVHTRVWSYLDWISEITDAVIEP